MHLSPENELPQAPFTIPKGFFFQKFFPAGLLGVLFVAFAAFLVIVSLNISGRLMEVNTIAAQGIRADEVGYEGTVETSRMVLKHYDLNVVYYLADGSEHSFKSDFYRLLSGPEDNDPVWVYYLETDPSTAILSWEADAVGHGWIMVAILLILGGVMVYATVSIVLGFRKTAATIRKLAVEGVLSWAEVSPGSMVQVDKANLSLGFTGPEGTVITHKYGKGKKDAPIFTPDASRILLWSSQGLWYVPAQRDSKLFAPRQ